MFFRRKKTRREMLMERLKEQPKVLLMKSGELIHVGRTKSGHLIEVGREKSGELLEKGKELSADLLEKSRDTSIALLEKVRPEPPKPKHRKRKALLAGGVLAAVYFFEPNGGPARRARAKAFVGRLKAKAYGMRQRMAHPYPEDTSYNDATLAAKVESELFTGLDIDRSRVKINAENGLIVLRGEVDRQEDIRVLEKAAANIPGVLGVRTLLHLPNTPAPNKEGASKAS